jgi:hypothetical protein
MSHAFNRSMKQFSVGSMPGRSVGRRLRKLKEETNKKLKEETKWPRYDIASRVECWTG